MNVDIKAIQSKKDLPQDLDTLRAFSWEVILSYQKLSEKYQELLRRQYGRSSEKLTDQSELDAIQMEMDALLEQLTITDANAKENENDKDIIEIPAHRRRRKHPGRNAIPEELITDVVIDVPDGEKLCDCCGKEKPVFDKKEKIVVERKPAEYKATRYIRLVRACPKCKTGVSIAEPVVTPIAKGIAGPMLLSFVLLSKYSYHLPLYRIQRLIFHESGIWFTRATMVSWIREICESLRRIHREMLTAYKQSRIKHADESPLQVRDPLLSGKSRQGWMWVGVDGAERLAVFLYDSTRNSQAALRLLKGSSKGDYLMTDDCPSYNAPVKEFGLISLRCMVHIRRNFVEAENTGYKVEFSRWVLRKIAQLYRIERFADKKGLSSGRRGELRKKYSAEILKQIKTRLENPSFDILPGSKIGQAINHFLKNWKEATRFLESGDLPIDNSVNERVIRALAIGRNNWMFAGSQAGAKWMAILYSIIATCKLNNIDPNEYFTDILMRLPLRSENADISDLTPLGWLKAKNGGELPPIKPLYPSKY